MEEVSERMNMYIQTEIKKRRLKIITEMNMKSYEFMQEAKITDYETGFLTFVHISYRDKYWETTWEGPGHNEYVCKDFENKYGDDPSTLFEFLDFVLGEILVASKIDWNEQMELAREKDKFEMLKKTMVGKTITSIFQKCGEYFAELDDGQVVAVVSE
jgi:hypothetical protein